MRVLVEPRVRGVGMCGVRSVRVVCAVRTVAQRLFVCMDSDKAREGTIRSPPGVTLECIVLELLWNELIGIP